MTFKSSTTGSNLQKLKVTPSGTAFINGITFGEEPKPYERLFGMTEQEIYNKFGLIFYIVLKIYNLIFIIFLV